MGDRLLALGRISLGVLTFLIYGWFTLMADNHSYMVGVPWVYGVELGFFLGVLWAIARIWFDRKQGSGLQWLGGGLDWVIFLSLATLTFSLMVSRFSQMTFMYSTISFAYIGILYGLQRHFTQAPKPLLQTPLVLAQGLLCWLFNIVSLGLWLQQTVLPELERLKTLRQAGEVAQYDFASLTLRNWAPFGHPNYVAGFLLLALPLLVGLAIATSSRWQRLFWSIGVGMGLITFYSTNSRGGWLGLMAMLGVLLFLLLGRSDLPKKWLLRGGLAGLTVLLLWAIQNERLRRTFTGLLSLGEQGGEFAYRWITICSGWRMGWAKPITGHGLGSVPLLYQDFRPPWAGLEAESLFQLHSTPVQIWAELGLLGMLTLGLGFWLWGRMAWSLVKVSLEMERLDQILVFVLVSAGVGYGVMALTDYQLDVLAIAGFWVINLALLSALYDRYVQKTKFLKPRLQPVALGMVGITLVGILLWLWPLNQAYAYGQRGFTALRQDNLEGFVSNLEAAHRKAPWQPYYAYQLGWTLGELSQSALIQPPLRKGLRQDALVWFEQAIANFPGYEFGPSSMGWLTLEDDPEAAVAHFSRAIELMPARALAMVGLGEGWRAQGESDKAVEAIALELVRFPTTITSPRWQTSPWQALYPDILQRTETLFTELLTQTSPRNQALRQYLQQNRGALRWYRGDLTGAKTDFQAVNSQLGTLLVALETTNPDTWQRDLEPAQRQFFERGLVNKEKWALAIAFWLDPAALPLPEIPDLSAAINQNIQQTLHQASSLRAWVQDNPPAYSERVQRIGFNIISRHIDGNNPTDFGLAIENAPIRHYLIGLFTHLAYEPELDILLEPYRQDVLAAMPKE
ncbi:MAG: O-antigen ligase family protein [Synechococcus sp.]|nr:O-antigen ligase family protein [Synechococcus sp.]